MKIGPSSTDGIGDDGGTTTGSTARSSPVRAGAGPAKPQTEVDRVTLSGKTASAASGGVVSFNEKKVEEIRQAIAEGRFPVDAKRVAEQLITDARDFIGITKQTA
jgi:negative regulator of flagellin synthesis FlgM